jgi:type II secretory pathway pseudopilin PulG
MRSIDSLARQGPRAASRGHERRRRAEAGLTYLALLFAIALLGATLAATATVYSHAVRRANEAQLIWIGNEFRDAIALYYLRSPGTVRRYPASLEDLIQDQRYLSLQRYLRRIYRDPMTGSTQWGLVMAPEGGVMGVYSLSELVPIKREKFDEGLIHFTNARSYRDWTFIFTPPVPLGKP